VAATRERETRIPASDAPVPGTIRMVEVGGHRVGIFNIEGELYALADRCAHRGGPLCSYGQVANVIDVVEGQLRITEELTLVRCPWHKWDFDVRTGTCPVDKKLRVRRYSVRPDGDELVVSLDSPGR
jgi:nitrite reductase/ring-hydroxylating ferredoxin subunit